MALTWRELEWRRNWARNNPDKVRYSNRRWRQLNAGKVRLQARERMRRLRAAQTAVRSVTPQRVAGVAG